MTAAPSAAKYFAIEAPIPLEAPVTTATFPVSFADIAALPFSILYFPVHIDVGPLWKGSGIVLMSTEWHIMNNL